MPHRRIIATGLSLALAVLAAGCGRPAVDSTLAGTWRGQVVTTSTRTTSPQVEDIAVTILPGGQFRTVGLMPGGGINRPGQVIRLFTGVPPGQNAAAGGQARVLSAQYAPDRSEVTLRFEGMIVDGRPTLAGTTQSARLLPDGRLEFRLFVYGMVSGDPARSESISHVGLLRREENATTAERDDAKK